MFMFTAKFNKKFAIAIVLALAVVLCLIIVFAGGRSRSDNSVQTMATSTVVKNNDQRVQFLNGLGWDVEESAVDEQSVVIPREFNSVYEEYNKIQLQQGFDLSKYGGTEATRYTYKVLNHPDRSSDVVIDIIVYRGQVIAGDVQSCALGGFMSGLLYPGKTA